MWCMLTGLESGKKVSGYFYYTWLHISFNKCIVQKIGYISDINKGV